VFTHSAAWPRHTKGRDMNDELSDKKRYVLYSQVKGIYLAAREHWRPNAHYTSDVARAGVFDSQQAALHALQNASAENGALNPPSGNGGICETFELCRYELLVRPAYHAVPVA